MTTDFSLHDIMSTLYSMSKIKLLLSNYCALQMYSLPENNLKCWRMACENFYVEPFLSFSFYKFIDFAADYPVQCLVGGVWGGTGSYPTEHATGGTLGGVSVR